MKIKVKGRLLFSSCYVNLNSLLINECQENTYYQFLSSGCAYKKARLCLTRQREKIWKRGGRAGSLWAVQGGQTRLWELHRAPLVSFCWVVFFFARQDKTTIFFMLHSMFCCALPINLWSTPCLFLSLAAIKPPGNMWETQPSHRDDHSASQWLTTR